MPYIPEEHKQYPVLRFSREHGGEVFQYHDWPDEKLNELVGDSLIPYGYKSYEEYYEKIDELIIKYANEPETVELLKKVKENIAKWNKKEEWSICRFVGDDLGEVFGLHHGGYYYWPCSEDRPTFSGVIDDEEFTAYIYPTEPELWEIIIDPTGMARKTIFHGVNALSKKNYDSLITQVKNIFNGSE